jgi:hypothetical protein
MMYLKQNTAVTIAVGPFISKTDGFTVATVTVANTKATLTADTDDNSAPTNVIDNVAGNDGTNTLTFPISGNDGGMGSYKLTAANVNRVGRACLSFHDVAAHCPVWHEFMILPANVYDSFVLGTDKLDANAAEVGGTSQTGRDLGTSVLLSSGTGTGQLDFTSGVVKANLVSILASALSGTAAQIAAAFVKFFDIATPTGTINVIPTVTTVTTATNLTNNLAKYMHGAVWIGTDANTNTTSYVDGIVSNPVSTIAAAKSIADNLKIKRFWVQAGTTVTLGAAHVGYCFDGRGYVLALGGQDVSKAQIDRCEGLSGTGICTTGEVVVYDSHLNAIAIGEADFVRCHLNGTVTLSQATVPYRFHDCTGIATAKITFSQANQTCVVSKVSGVLTIAGMTAATQVLYLDGDADVTLDNTNSAGSVYVAGNIRLTNSGSGQTITKTSMFEGNTQLTDILADTNELQTDWANGGRLDLLLDGASSAGDPWGAALPGAYGAGTAGRLVGRSLPDVAAGGSGGLLIAGTNAPVTITGSGNALTLTSTGANGSGLRLLGNGSGDGLTALGGTTGHGIQGTGAGNASGLFVTGAGTGAGITGSVAGNITGNVSGSVGSVTVVTDKTGYALSTAGVAAVWGYVVENSKTVAQVLRGIKAAVFGKLSGAATATVVVRDDADTKNRITVTADADGNRTAVVSNDLD